MLPRPSVPCTKSGAFALGRTRGCAGPAGHRDRAPRELDQPQSVRRPDLDVRVAEDGGDPQHLQGRRAQGEQDRHGVVDPGIGVDDDLAGPRVSFAPGEPGPAPGEDGQKQPFRRKTSWSRAPPGGAAILRVGGHDRRASTVEPLHQGFRFRGRAGYPARMRRGHRSALTAFILLFAAFTLASATPRATRQASPPSTPPARATLPSPRPPPSRRPARFPPPRARWPIPWSWCRSTARASTGACPGARRRWSRAWAAAS